MYASAAENLAAWCMIGLWVLSEYRPTFHQAAVVASVVWLAVLMVYVHHRRVDTKQPRE